MTEHTDTTLSQDILNPILETGLEGLPEAISLLINHAMLVERSQHLGAAPYQRNSLRNGHSNGFKNRCIESRLGAIDLKVPQVCNSDIPFYPNALAKLDPMLEAWRSRPIPPIAHLILDAPVTKKYALPALLDPAPFSQPLAFDRMMEKE